MDVNRIRFCINCDYAWEHDGSDENECPKCLSEAWVWISSWFGREERNELQAKVG